MHVESDKVLVVYLELKEQESKWVNYLLLKVEIEKVLAKEKVGMVLAEVVILDLEKKVAYVDMIMV